MDFKWVILIMLLLYVLPEIFKRRPKKYEYPDIPQPVPQPVPQPTAIPTAVSGKGSMWAMPQAKVKHGMPMSEVAPPMQVLHLQSQGGTWQGNLNQASVINGFIFAEVLQPPRAARPFEFVRSRPGTRKHC